MFYDRFSTLCSERKITVSRAAQEVGISKSLVTKWKTNQVDVPSPYVLNKLSKYFGIPLSELLCESPNVSDHTDVRTLNRDELKFALFQGRANITDSMLDEVISFAEYTAQREDRKNK